MTGVKVASFKLLLNLIMQLLSYEIDEYCDLKCDGQDNTVCQLKPCVIPKGDCPNGSALDLTDADRMFVLNEHNKYRNMTAFGKTYSRGTPETSGGMNILSYSKELEFSAQCWANSCSKQGDTCRKTPRYASVGQNFYFSQRLRLKWSRNFLHKAIESWYLESKRYRSNHTKVKGVASKRTARHFIQLVWPQTNFVGCGRSQHEKSITLICNYAPSAELKTKFIFDGEVPCSKCEDCNFHYTGLCGRVHSIDEDFIVEFKQANTAALHPLQVGILIGAAISLCLL